MRMGRISFTNVLPVYHALETNKVGTTAELIPDTPTALNKMIYRGELDITAVSSIAYARMAEEFIILPDLSISSDGTVQSVLLLSKVPIDKLDGESISVTIESATSVALLTILLESYYCQNVKLIPSPGSLKDMLGNTPAALLIGDSALRALHAEKDLYVYDLGQEWKKFTGEKMVFAVWIAKRAAVRSRHAEVYRTWNELQQSKQYGHTHPWEIAERASEITKLDSEIMLEYYRHLSYRLDEDYQRGLSCFFFHAYRIGLLDNPVKPEIWRGIHAAPNSRKSNSSRTFNIR